MAVPATGGADNKMKNRMCEQAHSVLQMHLFLLVYDLIFSASPIWTFNMAL